jgi:hypothetical protein
MDNLTKLFSKLQITNKNNDDMVIIMNLFDQLSLNATQDNMSSLIDQMSTLKIKDKEIEITMTNNTVIKISLISCHIEGKLQMDILPTINCF